MKQMHNEEMNLSNTVIDVENRRLYCQLCDVICTGPIGFTAHLNGRHHRRILEKNQASDCSGDMNSKKIRDKLCQG